MIHFDPHLSVEMEGAAQEWVGDTVERQKKLSTEVVRFSSRSADDNSDVVLFVMTVEVGEVEVVVADETLHGHRQAHQAERGSLREVSIVLSRRSIC